MADHLSSLPKSNERVSEMDMNVLRSVFGTSHRSNNHKDNEGSGGFVKGLKKLVFLYIVFVLINLPFIDAALKSLVPETSSLVFLLIKATVFIVIVFLGKLLG